MTVTLDTVAHSPVMNVVWLITQSFGSLTPLGHFCPWRGEAPQQGLFRKRLTSAWQELKRPQEGPGAEADGPFLVYAQRGARRAGRAGLSGPAERSWFVPKRPRGRQ